MMDKAIKVRHHKGVRWVFACCKCQKEFIGAITDVEFGKNKYCSRECFRKSVINNNRNPSIEHTKICLQRDAKIAEYYIENPNASLRAMGKVLNVSYNTVRNAINKYLYQASPVHRAISDLDSERAIELSKMYNI